MQCTYQVIPLEPIDTKKNDESHVQASWESECAAVRISLYSSHIVQQLLAWQLGNMHYHTATRAPSCGLCCTRPFRTTTGRQDFTTQNEPAVAVSQLTDLSRQVGWRSQLMAGRLADLSQASEASQTSPRPVCLKNKYIPHSTILVWRPSNSESRHLQKKT